MTANEAKKLMQEARRLDLSYLYNVIRASAQVGNSYCQVSLQGKLRNSVDEVIRDIQSNGFTVKRLNEHDDESCVYLMVSW